MPTVADRLRCQRSTVLCGYRGGSAGRSKRGKRLAAQRGTAHWSSDTKQTSYPLPVRVLQSEAHRCKCKRFARKSRQVCTRRKQKTHTFFSSSFSFGKTPTVRTDASFVRARVASTAKSAELAQGSFLQRFIIPKTGMSPNTDRIVFRRRLGREPSENIISFDLSLGVVLCGG